MLVTFHVVSNPHQNSQQLLSSVNYEEVTQSLSLKVLQVTQ